MIMLVTISLVTLAMTPIVTGKRKQKATISTNQFVCFYDENDDLHQIRITNNKLVSDENLTQKGESECVFQTEKGVATYNLRMVGGGGGGGGYTLGGLRLNDINARALATRFVTNSTIVNNYRTAAAFAGGVRYYFNHNIISGGNVSLLDLSQSDQDQTLDPYLGAVTSNNIRNDAFWYGFASQLMRGADLQQTSNCTFMNGTSFSSCAKTHSYHVGQESDNLIGITVSDMYGFCKGGQCTDFDVDASRNPDYRGPSRYCHSTCFNSGCPNYPSYDRNNTCSELRTTGNCTSGTLVGCTPNAPITDVRLSYDYKYLRYGVAGGAGTYINEQEADFVIREDDGKIKNPLPVVHIVPGKKGKVDDDRQTSSAGTESRVWTSQEEWVAQGGNAGSWNEGGVKKLYLIEDDKDIISPAKANLSDAPNIVVPTASGIITLPKGNGGAGAGVDSYSCNKGFIAIGYPANSPTRVFIKRGSEEITRTNWINNNDITNWSGTCSDSTIPATPRTKGENGKNGFVVISW